MIILKRGVMVETFDLIVIGGGTGGLRLALRAAGEGLKTAIVDPGVLGGTCLNTGCIPSKALLHAAELYQDILHAGKFGIEVGKVRPHFSKIMARMHAIVREGQEHITESVKARGLKIVRGKAVFVDQRTVQIRTKMITAKHFVISTGARPVVPSIRGIEKVLAMVSDDVLHLKTLPESLIIIGGGYIAMEFATFFASLGTKVTIIEHNSRILKELDSDITQLLEAHYRALGVSFLFEREILEIVGKEGAVGVVCARTGKKSDTIKASHLLIATGRAPNTESLGLDAAGVPTTDRGAIIVNDRLETANPVIYALGDVTGRAPFAHAAKREAFIILENILHGSELRMPFDAVPWAVFTDPPVGGIGLSEEKAAAKGMAYGVQKAEYRRAGRATIIGQPEGFVKVIYERSSRKVLGAFAIGARADDIIHEFVAFIKMGAKIEDVHSVIHIHPTLSEVVEALQDVEPLPLSGKPPQKRISTATASRARHYSRRHKFLPIPSRIC